MRHLGLVVMMLLSSTCVAEKATSVPPSIDWYFGCRKPDAKLPTADQPCWVQSATVVIAANPAKNEPEKKFYFQIHFFESKKVLRVFFEGSPLITIMPFLRPSAEEGNFGLKAMHVLECRDNSCCWESEIDDTELSWFRSAFSLGLLWRTEADRNEGISEGVFDAIKFGNFSASIAKLQAYWEKFK